MRRSLAVLLVLLLSLAPVAPALAAGNCAVFKTFQPGETLTAGNANASFTQVGVTNFIPDCMDDYSANVSQMQTTRDPYPAGAESLATSLSQELTGLRYVLEKVTGWPNWYKHTAPLAMPTFNFTANGDLEAWSAGTAVAPDSWTQTGAGGTVARNNSNIKHGAFSAAVTRVGTDTYLFQRADTLAGFGPVAWWQGKTVTLGAWVRATVSSRARLAIHDGVGTSTSTYHTGGSAFEYLSITRTLDAAATVVEIRLQVDSGDTTAQFDAVALTLGEATIDFLPSGTSAGVATGSIRQDHRGIHLRTHPDSDKAASQVMLVRAEEIVYDDGTRVTGWDREVADITVTGAGGRDAGIELADTWYEIYAIGQSSDGTVTRAKTSNDKLLLHRARNWPVDTSFTTSPDATRALRVATSTATDKIAQGFQLVTAGIVPFIEVQLSRAGAVAGNVWFTIEADTAGAPTGTPLVTCDKVNAAKISTTAQTIRTACRTPSPASLTAGGTQYHLVLQGDYTRSDTVNIRWHGLVAGGYANGQSQDYNGTTWTATPGANGLDRWFRVYIEQNNAAVVMPGGYDQKALLGYVHNNASSHFKSFVQLGRKLIAGGDDANWNIGNTAVTPVLLDVANFLPPVPVIAMFASGINSTTGTIRMGPYFAYDLPNSGGVPTEWARMLHGVTGNLQSSIVIPDVLVEYQAVFASGNTAQPVWVQSWTYE